MSIIFNKLIEHSENFQKLLGEKLSRADEEHDFPWDNLVYESKYVRRAHLDVVDKREEKKLFMMHLCVFPHVQSTAPIYGFDLIAGPNKVTGAFHDFSPVYDSAHPLAQRFAENVSGYTWSKKRELPDWARAIFSENMVAAGNIKDENELDEVLELSLRNLRTYINYLELETKFDIDPNVDFTQYQNKYCYFQKQNPHTPRVMESLGYDPETVQRFIQTCLFPEI